MKILINNSNLPDVKNRTQESFLRGGYFGGHVDVYKPRGDNLYYYDLNSLYPFVMKKYPMPSGEAVWKNNLLKEDLDTLYGFVEAFVVCPTTMDHPFLPYKDRKGRCIFPTGSFIGVFYSEELKFARHLGYEILPLRGYFFEKKASPVKGILSDDLYQRRIEATKEGDEPMRYI